MTRPRVINLPWGNGYQARVGRYFNNGPCHRETIIKPKQGPTTGIPISSPDIGDTGQLRNITEMSNNQIYKNNITL